MRFGATISSLLVAALAPGLNAQLQVSVGTALGSINFVANEVSDEWPMQQRICQSLFEYVFSPCANPIHKDAA
ncbi:uncharacterized protein BDV14DRAFT_205144 [Aspergillus stella-maris]|uniref:uncharacterized protein n=1 Tax=Aspergillus stella-maris TaxID=1810926 RepID=UPI003CCC9089